MLEVRTSTSLYHIMTSEGAPVAQSSGTSNNTDVPSTSTYQQATCCADHANLQNLKQKKIELEKKLNEKCKLLSQIIRDENNLLKLAASNSVPVMPNTSTTQSSIRRKIVGTSFKLPENLLNSPPCGTSPSSLASPKQKHEINQLLLEKKIQQQTSEAAMKLANDVSQTKLIRKTHRQCHDLAQEKLKVIEKNILLMQLQNTATDRGKNIVRHNSIKITMPMSINQPTRYHQQNEKLNSSHHPYPNTNTIPSISINHKQVYNSSKDAKIKKSAFLDSEYNYSGTPVPGGSPSYNDVQYLAGDIISPNYGNVNPMDDDFAQYPTCLAVYHNPKLKQSQYQNGGLGGYWCTLENNERIWCSMDNRFSSLDRKTNQIVKTIPQKTQSPQQPTKSTSLGNFEFISVPNLSKNDEGSDSISISSINSENKKPKDKIWSETSLDSPTISIAYKSTSNPLTNNSNGRLNGSGPHKASSQLYNQLHYNHPPNTPAQILHHRTNESAAKPKLSSHSMSLPNRNFVGGPPNHMMPYDDLYLTTPSYPDYYQPMPPSPDGSIKSPTSRLQNNRIMTSPIQSQQPPATVADPEAIRYEPLKNVTVIQQAKFRPYKEISKPFEMADFYKYSTKFRQKNNPTSLGANEPDPGRSNKMENKNRSDLDDLNSSIQKIYYQPPNPSLCQPINYQ